MRTRTIDSSHYEFQNIFRRRRGYKIEDVNFTSRNKSKDLLLNSNIILFEYGKFIFDNYFKKCRILSY